MYYFHVQIGIYIANSKFSTLQIGVAIWHFRSTLAKNLRAENQLVSYYE